MDEERGARVYREYRWFALILLALVLGVALRLSNPGASPISAATQPAADAAGAARH
jgi:hypothetical protein